VIKNKDMPAFVRRSTIFMSALLVLQGFSLTWGWNCFERWNNYSTQGREMVKKKNLGRNYGLGRTEVCIFDANI